jgi:hypothetical protein
VAVGPDGVPAISTRIGDDVLDLGRLEAAGCSTGRHARRQSLNAFSPAAVRCGRRCAGA